MYVQKKTSLIQAWRLGAGTTKEKELIAKKAIILKEDDTYELFSREATDKTGQIAKVGDYFKVDSNGYPYPNEKKNFEAHTSMLTQTGIYKKLLYSLLGQLSNLLMMLCNTYLI